MRSANKLITGRSSVIKKFQTLGVASQDYPLMYSWLNKICCNATFHILAVCSCKLQLCACVQFNPSTRRRQATRQTVKCSQHCLKTTPAMHVCATEHLCSHSALIPEILPTLTLILISYHSREDKQSLRPESRTHYQMSRGARGHR